MKLVHISTQRKNMKVLTECHENFLPESYNKTMHDSCQSNNFPMAQIADHPNTISQFIIDFDELKRNSNSNETDFVA